MLISPMTGVVMMVRLTMIMTRKKRGPTRAPSVELISPMTDVVMKIRVTVMSIRVNASHL